MQIYNVLPDSKIFDKCPFCGFSFYVGDRVVKCPACLAHYHIECWESNSSHCSRFGCSGYNIITNTPPVPLSLSSIRTTTSQVIRLRPSDFTGVKGTASRRVTSPQRFLVGIWQYASVTFVVTTCIGLLLGLLYRYAGIGLSWAMGAERLQNTFLLQSLYEIGQFSLWGWAVVGAIYGLLHRGFLSGKNRAQYQFIRFVLIALYTGSLAYQLGHLIFAPGYLWPTLLYGLPAKILWLAPLVAWGFLFLMILSSISIYSGRDTMFELVLGLVVLAILLLLYVYWYTIINAALWGFAGWVLGGSVDLVWRGRDFSTSWFHWGLTVGGSLGVIFGSINFIKLIITMSPAPR